MTILDAPSVTDDADDDDNDGVMIALLPTSDDWCEIDLPHMTLVYAGVTGDHKPSDFNELAKDAAMVAMLARPIYLRSTGIAVFGEDPEKVNVVKLMPTQELWAMRRAVEDWDVSDYPFNPHCTIGPADGIPDQCPMSIGFDRVYVAFGEENLTFLMKGSM